MNFRPPRKTLIIVCIIFVVFLLAFISRWQAGRKSADQASPGGGLPVETGTVTKGPIELRRIFSGSLEPDAEFVIAPKVSGRLERIYVDLGDVIEKGQVVAELDNDEFLQAVALAEADLRVSQAKLVEAENALEIATRDLRRFETLRSRGVASDSQLDTARADQLSKQAARDVARAQVTRAEALLETARIRLGYTRVAASWSDEGGSRVVSERFVDEGETVAANAPLVSIVSLDPMKGIIFVTEKDYANLKTGQAATLETDAFPDDRFNARIERIAPVFGPATRQAKVELKIENPLLRLKPGMFIRVSIVLDRIEDAVIVPEQALTTRDDKAGVFLVDRTGRTVSWRPVRPGIRENGKVQIKGPFPPDFDPPVQVVTLGQQLLNDGAAIIVPDHGKTPPSGERETPAR